MFPAKISFNKAFSPLEVIESVTIVPLVAFKRNASGKRDKAVAVDLIAAMVYTARPVYIRIKNHAEIRMISSVALQTLCMAASFPG